MDRKEKLIEEVLYYMDSDAPESTIEEIKNMSEEQLMMLLEDYAIDDDMETVEEDPEIISGLLACNEEKIRQRLLYEEEHEVSEEVKNTDIFKNSMAIVETVIAGVRTMVSAGLDYSNSFSMMNNIIMNDHNLKMAKIGAIQADKNQI